jgi:hypothetical protein
LVDVPVLKEAD